MLYFISCSLQLDLYTNQMITTTEVSVATTPLILAPVDPYHSNGNEMSNNPSNFVNVFNKAGVNLFVVGGVAVIILLLVLGFWIFMCHQTYLKMVSLNLIL